MHSPRRALTMWTWVRS